MAGSYFQRFCLRSFSSAGLFLIAGSDGAIAVTRAPTIEIQNVGLDAA